MQHYSGIHNALDKVEAQARCVRQMLEEMDKYKEFSNGERLPEELSLKYLQAVIGLQLAAGEVLEYGYQ